MNVIINLNKPKGISSQQAVTQVKRILGVRKAGHAGTLDPIATGVLLVCTGEATKIARFLSDLYKEYIAVVKLGERTDTYDSEGEVVQTCEGFSFKKEEIENVLMRFTGTIEQTPPMYSAIKRCGKPLYRLARKGIMVERSKRTVMIHGIEITGFNLPLLEMKISCSKGTYIRSLCDDIGEALGVGAHITELNRTQVGDFSIEDSVTLDDLKKTPETAIVKFRGIDAALGHLRELSLTDREFAGAKHGLPLKCLDFSFLPNEYIKLKDPSGSLFAIGRAINSLIKIERMLHVTDYP